MLETAAGILVGLAVIALFAWAAPHFPVYATAEEAREVRARPPWVVSEHNRRH